MTTHDERWRSLEYAHDFLIDLIHPHKTPRVPKSIRKQAHRVLRHYPSKFEIKTMKEGVDYEP